MNQVEDHYLQAPEAVALAKRAQALRAKPFSDIISGQGPDTLQYVDLVMEGGGVLGIALVGYCYILEQANLRFLGIAGTSAGAINATLLAAMDTPSQPKSPKIIRALATVPMGSFVDGDSDAQDLVHTFLKVSAKEEPSLLDKVKIVAKGVQVVDNLEEQLGLNPGLAFERWITDQLDGVGIHTTAQLRQRLNTLPPDLRLRATDAPLTDPGAELVVIAADLTTKSKVQFPRMAELYWDPPDKVHPARYVRASMSIPFFFHPYAIYNLPEGEQAAERWRRHCNYSEAIPLACYLVDGGVVSNFPIHTFHNYSKIPDAPTFGAKLGENSRLSGVTPPTGTEASKHGRASRPGGLVGAIFDLARHCLDDDFIVQNPDYSRLVTPIPTGEHHWLNFSMSDRDKLDLFLRGARAAIAFLEGFHWEDYKKIRARSLGLL
jgi:NTE family protein